MILIALGSNITGPWGSPHETVVRATKALNTWPLQLIKCSTLIETKPYGIVNQPSFINAVAIIETALTAPSLLMRLHRIEKAAGRKRGRKWGPRCLDLDIIDYRGMIFGRSHQTQRALILPHPGIAKRSFVLGPIAEIAPRWRHPKSRQTAVVTLSKL
jgi:2-amino-4-hydroxy-6-hydroxymethyldihydropteridine diphosphokinase